MKNEAPLFFGFFTLGTPYEDEYRTLKSYFEMYCLDHEYHGVPNLGSWQKNTQFKAQITMQMLRKHPNRRLCYMDVDSMILSPPTHLNTVTADIAAVIFPHHILLSGVVLYAPNERTLACVQTWLDLNIKYPEKLPDGRDAWDQRTLQMAIKQTPGLKFQALPQAYNFIPDLSRQQFPDVVPVIVSTRGGQRFQAKINSGAYQ